MRPNVHSRRRWMAGAVAGGLTCALMLAFLWRCLMYIATSSKIGFILVPGLIVFLGVGLANKGRTVLALVTLATVFFLVPVHLNPIPIAAAESAAVSELVEMHGRWSAAGEQLPQKGFTIEPSTATFPVDKYFRFEYQPQPSTEHQTRGFLVTATLRPSDRQCGCTRSFAMTESGSAHYTTDARRATGSDPTFDIPAAVGTSRRR